MLQKHIILKMLTQSGTKGVTTKDIVEQCFIPNYTGRISDLRKDGYTIKAEKIKGKNYSRYFLIN